MVVLSTQSGNEVIIYMVAEFDPTSFAISLVQVAAILMYDLKTIFDVPIYPHFPEYAAAFHATIKSFVYLQALAGLLLTAPEATKGQAAIYFDHDIARRHLAVNLPFHEFVNVGVTDV